MSVLSVQGEQSSSSEIAVLTALNNLAVAGAGEFIRKTGTSTFTNESPTTGFVTSVSVVTANGISGSVATPTTTPAITLTLGAITPSAIQVSGLTASTLVATDGTKNLQSLSLTTYPSLTEIAYVKGVTSALQTQIDTKSPSTAPTFATSITGSYLTASEILITDASKNIVSAAVATYPSLTELSYVKGVTSALQTQMNLKSPLASPTFTGTVTVPTPFTIGAVSMTATGTELNYVAGVTSAIQTQFTGKLSLSGGTMTGSLVNTIANTANYIAINITNSDTTNNPRAMVINSATVQSSGSVYINQTGNGIGFWIDNTGTLQNADFRRNNASPGDALFQLYELNSSAAQKVFSILNAGTGYAAYFDNISDNTTVLGLKIRAVQASITTADTFIEFSSNTGVEGTVQGTATPGVIAYNTFTGSHWSQSEEIKAVKKTVKNNHDVDTEIYESELEAGTVLVSINEICYWKGEVADHLPKCEVSSKKEDKAVYGVYGGHDTGGDIMVLALGAGKVLVCDEGGQIEVGDFLCTSSKKGYAMKYEGNDMRVVLGKARQSFSGKDGSIACTYLCG